VSEAAAFDQLVEEFYRAWFHYHPEAAVDAGVDGYATLLAPHGDDDIGALVSLDESLLGALDEIDPGRLDADRRLDYHVLRGAVRIEHHDLLERDWRYRDPVRFLPVNAVYQLTVRPVPEFPTALITRVSAIPEHLRSARRYLAELPDLIPSVWLQAAVVEARAGAGFLRGLPDHPKVVQGFPSLGRLHTALDQAARALDEFAHFLEAELASSAEGGFACGRTHFERILRERHFLDVDADALHAYGVSLFDETLRQLEEVTRRLRGDTDVAAVTAEIRARHPEAERLLDAYRTQMQAAYRFVQERDLVTVPARQRLQVVDTPTFLRHEIPFAAYLQPAANDPDQCGYYYVTPAADAALLGEHNSAGLAHTCVHEAWPGHHLQFVTAHARPESSTLPRLLNPSATLYEGWALYCEQLMTEQGFLEGPEHEFILLRDRLWRALRVQLDVELHCRGLDLDVAAGRMAQTLGFPREQALADLLWYTRAPGVPMGYAVGWALINAARDVKAAGPALKEFHDRLLAPGSVALPLVLERAFGADLRREARARVFGAGA